MSGRIPENKIDEVRSAADIVEVISGYLSLKRRGRNYTALCPFHSEKTPSFSVSPDRQIFHCFGCGKGGNVFTFLMDHEKLSFVEAVKSLADRYGIALPRYEPGPDARTERLLYAHEVAADYFQTHLKSSRFRGKIEPYLYQRRGLTAATVEKFQIGFAPDDWQGLLTYATRKDLKPEELLEAGLILRSEKTGDYIDRFRMRLMFPIYNLGGKIIGFGGRTLKKGEQVKYMNSPETPLYNKSFVLYGLNFSKAAIREAGSVIVVEGYFDFLSLFQAGIENVVAVSGTAFTPQQSRLISRFAQRAYLFFDADSAGRNASLRSIEHFFNAGLEPVIVTPPPGHDPDSYVREQGPQAVHKLLEQSVDYLSFRFNGVDASALTMREKEQVARETRQLAAKIDDPLRREIFIAAAAVKLRLPQSVFGIAPDGRLDETDKLPVKPKPNMMESEFLSLFVARPALIESIWNDISPDDLQGPEHRAIYAMMIESYRATGDINPAKMIEHVTELPQKSLLSFIASLGQPETDLVRTVKDYKRTMLARKRDRQVAVLQEKLAEAERRGDREEAKKLSLEIKYLLEKQY